jgi:hypothetical protein
MKELMGYCFISDQALGIVNTIFLDIAAFICLETVCLPAAFSFTSVRTLI